MNAVNRPIDILLNSEQPSIASKSARNDDVTYSKIKENRFDQVLAERQRAKLDAAQQQRDQRAQAQREAQATASAKAAAQRQQADSARQAKENERAQNGKELPRAQRSDGQQVAKDNTKANATDNVKDNENSAREANTEGAGNTNTAKNEKAEKTENHQAAGASAETNGKSQASREAKQEVAAVQIAQELLPQGDAENPQQNDTGETGLPLSAQEYAAGPKQGTEGDLALNQHDNDPLSKSSEAEPQSQLAEEEQRTQQEQLAQQEQIAEAKTEAALQSAALHAAAAENAKPEAALANSAVAEQAKQNVSRQTAGAHQTLAGETSNLAQAASDRTERAADNAKTNSGDTVKAEAKLAFTDKLEVKEDVQLKAKPDFSALADKAATAKNLGLRAAAEIVAAKEPASLAPAAKPAAEQTASQAVQNAVKFSLPSPLQTHSDLKASGVRMNVHVPMSSPNWGQAVAQRVVWLAGNGVRGAEIQLNPQDLGPMEVKISVNNDQTSVTFVSQHAATRETLEANLPRLREMLNGNGLDLVDVNVADQSMAEQSEGSNQQDATGRGKGFGYGQDVAGDEIPAQVIGEGPVSLIDFYA